MSRPSLALLLASLLWGTSFPATEYALKYFSPGPIIFLRFSLSTLILVLLFRRFPALHGYGLLAGILNALAFGFQFFGQVHTTASKVAIISNTFPVYTAVLSPLLLGERPTGRQIFALIFGLSGVFLVGGVYDLYNVNVGDLMNFVASLFYAFYVIYSRKAMADQDPVGFTLTAGFSSSLVSLFYLPVGFRAALHPTGMAAIGWLVVFPSTLGYLLYAYGIRGKGAVSSSILILSTVLFGAFTSLLLLGETLSPTEWVGLGLIALAILMAG